VTDIVPHTYTEITYYTAKIGFIKKISIITTVMNLETDMKHIRGKKKKQPMKCNMDTSNVRKKKG
jgi:hypothetical protein